jgi:hypothetical protein
LISILKSILVFLIPEDFENLFILFGDWVHFLRAKYHITIAVIIHEIIGLVLQLRQYWYYKNNIKPLYQNSAVLILSEGHQTLKIKIKKKKQIA